MLTNFSLSMIKLFMVLLNVTTSVAGKFRFCLSFSFCKQSVHACYSVDGKEDMQFSSDPRLESDCEDFFSVNGGKIYQLKFVTPNFF